MELRSELRCIVHRGEFEVGFSGCLANPIGEEAGGSSCKESLFGSDGTVVEDGGEVRRDRPRYPVRLVSERKIEIRNSVHSLSFCYSW